MPKPRGHYPPVANRTSSFIKSTSLKPPDKAKPKEKFVYGNKERTGSNEIPLGKPKKAGAVPIPQPHAPSEGPNHHPSAGPPKRPFPTGPAITGSSASYSSASRNPGKVHPSRLTNYHSGHPPTAAKRPSSNYSEVQNFNFKKRPRLEEANGPRRRSRDEFGSQIFISFNDADSASKRIRSSENSSVNRSSFLDKFKKINDKNLKPRSTVKSKPAGFQKIPSHLNSRDSKNPNFTKGQKFHRVFNKNNDNNGRKRLKQLQNFDGISHNAKALDKPKYPKNKFDHNNKHKNVKIPDTKEPEQPKRYELIHKLRTSDIASAAVYIGDLEWYISEEDIRRWCVLSRKLNIAELFVTDPSFLKSQEDAKKSSKKETSQQDEDGNAANLPNGKLDELASTVTPNGIEGSAVEKKKSLENSESSKADERKENGSKAQRIDIDKPENSAQNDPKQADEEELINEKHIDDKGGEEKDDKEENDKDEKTPKKTKRRGLYRRRERLSIKDIELPLVLNRPDVLQKAPLFVNITKKKYKLENQITKIKFHIDKTNGKSAGLAYVEFKDVNSAILFKHTLKFVNEDQEKNYALSFAQVAKDPFELVSIIVLVIEEPKKKTPITQVLELRDKSIPSVSEAKQKEIDFNKKSSALANQFLSGLFSDVAGVANNAPDDRFKAKTTVEEDKKVGVKKLPSKQSEKSKQAVGRPLINKFADMKPGVKRESLMRPSHTGPPPPSGPPRRLSSSHGFPPGTRMPPPSPASKDIKPGIKLKSPTQPRKRSLEDVQEYPPSKTQKVVKPEKKIGIISPPQAGLRKMVYPSRQAQVPKAPSTVKTERRSGPSSSEASGRGSPHSSGASTPLRTSSASLPTSLSSLLSASQYGPPPPPGQARQRGSPPHPAGGRMKPATLGLRSLGSVSYESFDGAPYNFPSRHKEYANQKPAVRRPPPVLGSAPGQSQEPGQILGEHKIGMRRAPPPPPGPQGPSGPQRIPARQTPGQGPPVPPEQRLRNPPPLAQPGQVRPQAASPPVGYRGPPLLAGHRDPPPPGYKGPPPPGYRGPRPLGAAQPRTPPEVPTGAAPPVGYRGPPPPVGYRGPPPLGYRGPSRSAGAKPGAPLGTAPPAGYRGPPVPPSGLKGPLPAGYRGPPPSPGYRGPPPPGYKGPPPPGYKGPVPPPGYRGQPPPPNQRGSPPPSS